MEAISTQLVPLFSLEAGEKFQFVGKKRTYSVKNHLASIPVLYEKPGKANGYDYVSGSYCYNSSRNLRTFKSSLLVRPVP